METCIWNVSSIGTPIFHATTLVEKQLQKIGNLILATIAENDAQWILGFYGGSFSPIDEFDQSTSPWRPLAPAFAAASVAMRGR